ncbi:MAG: DNA polymerase-3 subunit delta [Pelagibacterales bacterium]|nr:DNA polymerase-3 subunit delta [Pelagibacterales bacterium]
MILKSYIVEQNIGLLRKNKVNLLYGENDGIKDDIKTEIKNEKGEAEIINLFQEEILKDNKVLFDHIQNLSLFSLKKIIFIHEVTDKLYKDICELTENKLENIEVYIYASALDKRSKLRSYFEKEKSIAIVACYQDNERTLSNYIRNKLKGLTGLTQEITNIIIYNSNLNRKSIKSEISKIKVFFGENKIEKEKVLQLLNVTLNKEFGQIRDAALLGDKIKVNRLMGEIEFTNEDIYSYLNQIAARLNNLNEIQNLNLNINNLETAVDSLSPKVFWKDKPIYINQLKNWDKKKLEETLLRVSQLELFMKKNSNIRNDVLIKDLIVGLCVQATNHV